MSLTYSFQFYTMASKLLFLTIINAAVALDLEVVNQWNLFQIDPPYGYSATDFK